MASGSSSFSTRYSELSGAELGGTVYHRHVEQPEW